MRKPPPQVDDVRRHVRYDPETGRVTRLVGNARSPVGSEAGTIDERGYRYLSVNKRKLAAHRVAILLTSGAWPDGEVDHINGMTGDNRICNLRVVDRSTNMQNRKRAQNNNASSGMLGVTWNARAGKWQAQIKADGRGRYIGLFLTPEAAHSAYLQVKRATHAGCTI